MIRKIIFCFAMLAIPAISNAGGSTEKVTVVSHAETKLAGMEILHTFKLSNGATVACIWATEIKWSHRSCASSDGSFRLKRSLEGDKVFLVGGSLEGEYPVPQRSKLI